MVLKVLLSSSVLSVMLAVPAFAQNATTIIREAVPVQSTAIVANSAQDIALQEEIRKIRAYNAYVDSQVGVSETIEVFEPVPTQAYTNARVELFAAPAPTMSIPQITYAAAPDLRIQTVPVTTTSRNVETMNTGYRVAQGDTLYALARSHCISVSDIQNANSMTDNNLRLGQSLSMPASRCDVIATRAESSAIVDNSYIRKVMPVPTNVHVGSANNYAVLPKDTLYSIGRRYCISANEVARHNGLATSKAIQPGQILHIPDTACLK